MNNTNNSNKTTTKTSDKFWKYHVKRYQSLNISKAMYAKKNNLVKHKFIYWCQKFEKQLRPIEQAKPDFVPIKIEDKIDTSNETTLFTLKLGAHNLLIHSAQGLKILLANWR